ncbi:hypothetical protein AB0L75_35950 [Streptomyces sp. NPDC052101]|uniref:hypothetical protein n=1 Tax=Streptomyces sp. NPDC052101 TaxID=3155763 RepID=UPI0034206F6B
MNTTRSESSLPASQMTDEELAQRAAEVAVSWVRADSPLSKNQGWELVGLQYPGSAQGEMYVWRRVWAWEQQLAQALADADDSEEGHGRVAAARSEAISQMRDMLLSGIRSGEQFNKFSFHPVDPRTRLHTFIGRSQ